MSDTVGTPAHDPAMDYDPPEEPFAARLRRARADLEDAQHDFLRHRGWTESSLHPDCCWRWSKAFGEREYHLATEAAISMEERAIQ